MSKIRGSKELFWDASPGAVDYVIYAGDANIPHTTFVAQADLKPENGGLAPYAVSVTPFWDTTGLTEGNWQFAVCARDAEKNEANPSQFAAWQNIPLDLTPPAAVLNGGVRSSPG